jgi:chromate reductase
MATIVGIAGSLRSGSLNAALLRAAAGMMPPGSTLHTASIREVPLYDGDVEARDGIPLPVQQLKATIMSAQGLLLVSPEYNNGIPGVFKNAIDWLSRPPGDIPAVFGNRPTAVIGASPGGFGTILAQNAWLPVLKTLGTRHWSGGRLMVARAGAVFDGSGNLADAKVQGQLRQFMENFVKFVDSV